MTTERRNKPRRHPRIPLALEVRCDAYVKPMTYVSRNISSGGVFMEAAQVYPQGARLALSCKLPYAHGELQLKGIVVRHSQEALTGLVDGMAIEFESLTDADRQALDAYLQETQDAAEAASAKASGHRTEPGSTDGKKARS